MERPRTKGKEHSYVELEEDENVVEKYTRAMESIANVLQLDQLKQVSGISGWGRWVGQAIAVKAAGVTSSRSLNSYSSIVHMYVCSASLFADVMKIPQNYIHTYIHDLSL